jgi:mono/diheme cytochrome c family protein
MPAQQTKDLRTRKILFVILLMVIAGAIGFTIWQNRPWTIPESARAVKNPLPPSAADLDTIRPIYRDKCAVCHGDTGKGDGHDATLYDPKPTDFTNALHMRNVTDGELFYKLTEGRKPMPSFKKRLTDEQRWRMVMLIRTFLEPTSVGPAESAPTAH